MKLAPMLYCAGLNSERYKVLKSRFQTPFETEDQGGWKLGGNDYTLDHSFRLRLQNDLLGGEGDGDDLQHKGLPPAYAQQIVCNAMKQFPRHPLTQIEPLEWWAGVLIMQEEIDEETTIVSSWFAGELQGIGDWVAEQCKRDDYSLVPVRLFITNATAAADSVLDRAAEIGLNKPDNYPKARI